MKSMNSIGRSFSWAYIDRMTTQGLSLIISIVLARLIDPAHYGIVVIAMIFVGILNIFMNPGLSSALVQKKAPDETDYSSMFWFNLLISFLLYAVIFIASPWIEAFYEMEDLSLIIRVMSARLPFGALQSVQMAFVQKNLLYRQFFFVSLFGTLIAGICAIFMASAGFGVWALVANSMINCVLDTLLALVFIPWRPSRAISFTRFKAMFAFGRRILAAKLIDTVYSDISAFIIGKKYVSSDLSFYNKGRLFPQELVQNISASISDVLFPVLSNIQDDLDRLKSTMRSTIRISTYILFPLLVGMFVCADSFIELLLTDVWLPCVPYLRIMCIYYLCVPASGVMLQGIKALGRGGTLLQIEIIKKLYSITIVVVAIILFDNPLAIAAGIMLSGGISVGINLFAAKKIINYSLREHMKDVAPTIMLCLVMAVAVYLIGLSNTHNAVKLMLQIVTGIAVYMFFSYVFKTEQFFIIMNHFKKKKELDEL